MLVYIAIYIVLCIPLVFIFKKLNQPIWQALIPFANLYFWCKALNCPWWWTILIVLPGVNFIMLLAMFVLSFRAIKEGVNTTRKTEFREFIDSLVYAVVAATVIHLYFIQPFMIPTSSMEKSLLVGDYLFVSKISYGQRIPFTPLAFPFVHNTTLKNNPSFSEAVKLPYFRLPGLGKVERNDVVVFNFPEQDTLIYGMDVVHHQPDLTQTSYYHHIRGLGYESIIKKKSFEYNDDEVLKEGRKLLKARETKGEVVIATRPIDKEDNYVKRCVGIAGDELEIKNGVLYVNGKPSEIPDNSQLNYAIKSTGQGIFKVVDSIKVDNGVIYRNGVNTGTNDNFRGQHFETVQVDDKAELFKKYNITEPYSDGKNLCMPLSTHVLEAIKKEPGFISATPLLQKAGEFDYKIFPHNPKLPWNLDNFGPMLIPKEGFTINLTNENLSLYKRIITAYEGNTLAENAGKVLINGKETTTYTFKQNYYWLMGDNRHNSLDARYWGFVPENHVVGTPILVVANKKEGEWKFRPERFFMFVTKRGTTGSFGWVVFPIIAAWIFIPWYMKRKKKKAEEKARDEKFNSMS